MEQRSGAHTFDGFRRAHDNRVSPETKVRFAAKRRLLRRKPTHRFPIPSRHWRTAPPAAFTRAIPPATSQMFGLSKRATRSMPAATNAHSIAADPVLRVSQFLSCTPPHRDSRKAPPYGRVELRRHIVVFKAKFATCAGMIDAGPQRVTGRAPHGPHNGPSAPQDANRSGEHGKAIDEVGRAVDRVDSPHTVMRASRALDHFLPDDIMSGKSFSHPAADQGFNALIDFGHRIAPQRLLR